MDYFKIIVFNKLDPKLRACKCNEVQRSHLHHSEALHYEYDHEIVLAVGLLRYQSKIWYFLDPTPPF